MQEEETSKTAFTSPFHHDTCKFFVKQGCIDMPGFKKVI